MGLFGKSDREKERDEQARHEEARRKMEEARRRQQQAAGPAAAATTNTGPAAKPSAGAAKPGGPAVVPASQPVAQDGETYTVAEGDSLSKIAKKHLGDADEWRRIYEANRQTIGDDPDKIFPGQKLRIPKRTGGGSQLA